MIDANVINSAIAQHVKDQHTNRTNADGLSSSSSGRADGYVTKGVYFDTTGSGEKQISLPRLQHSTGRVAGNLLLPSLYAGKHQRS